MKRRLVLAGLAAAVALQGCARVAESRFNPFNWFGQSEPAQTVATAQPQAEARSLVPQVTALVIERTPTGAIVRATGLPPTQGWYGAELVAETEDPVNGELVFAFHAEPPLTPQPVSTVQSRELTAAATVTTQDLARVRVIRVQGAQNARVASR